MESYIKKKYMVILFVFVLILPVILQYAVFENSVTSNASNDGWASFLGSYIGGVFGGGMTLAAVLVSIQETKRVQEENKIESRKRMAETTFRASRRINKIQRGNEILQKHKERIEFCNDVAVLVGRYCADISKYFYDCRLKTGAANRIISIECIFTLRIKLKDIDTAKSLVDELNNIHDRVCADDVELAYITEATSKLMTLSSEFINAYVAEVDLTSY